MTGRRVYLVESVDESCLAAKPIQGEHVALRFLASCLLLPPLLAPPGPLAG